MLNPHIFRAYDVRGRVGSDVNPEVFEQVGRAYATLILRTGGRVVAVGQDNRESSTDLRAAFVNGVRAAGVDVVDIGLVTTPILYFATAHWKLDGGANITGSHNPIEYNGVKMVHRGAVPLSEDEIQSLRKMVETSDWDTGRGRLETRSPREDYFSTVQRLVRLPRRLTIVADAGNGIAGVYGPELLRRLGCQVVELHCESDGSFPNHLPDPEDPENVVDLQEKVVEVGADLGVAWDGDADRVGIIDERGHRHEADLILVLLARDLRAEGPLPRRREVPRDQRALPRPQAALRDHRHRRGPRALPRRWLGPRPRLQHESVPHAALRGEDGRRDRADEARDLRRAQALPLRHAAVRLTRLHARTFLTFRSSARP